MISGYYCKVADFLSDLIGLPQDVSIPGSIVDQSVHHGHPLAGNRDEGAAASGGDHDAQSDHPGGSLPRGG